MYKKCPLNILNICHEVVFQNFHKNVHKTAHALKHCLHHADGIVTSHVTVDTAEVVKVANKYEAPDMV